VKSNDAVKFVTVRGTAFEAAVAGGDAAAVEAAPDAEKVGITEWVGEDIQKSDRPDLGSASRVISGGRGMKNGENFKLLYDMADKLGAAGKLNARLSSPCHTN
jgi:electron transfer flavoprotein alpha subunit